MTEKMEIAHGKGIDLEWSKVHLLVSQKKQEPNEECIVKSTKKDDKLCNPLVKFILKMRGYVSFWKLLAIGLIVFQTLKSGKHILFRSRSASSSVMGCSIVWGLAFGGGFIVHSLHW